MSDEARERWMSIAAAFDALIAQIDTTIDLAEQVWRPRDGTAPSDPSTR
ncbi:hypothetical protein [Sphingomonas hankyongi]|uniref:Uncharacterized protein n=1 Tax=Sphingomonas hankyongi TaxID=2908209 RepID=A0ABT0S307_9SPHN|nr:hypothetical protein [Sphingomonas hankyongi]MCL6730238.1 hypothetical protein [Sphingomonas hankyongi]